MAGDDWKKLPDAKPTGKSWRDLPDVEPGADTGVPGSPLEQALKSQAGPVVTVQTPTGPALFTRQGARFFSPEESKQVLDSSKPRERQVTLEGMLSFLSGGGPMMDELRGAGSGAAAGVRGQDPLAAYRATRDDTRREVARATKNASPSVHVAGTTMPLLPMLGAAAPQLLAPNPSTFLGRIALGAEQGAQNALGASDADATQGQAKELAQQILREGAIGAGVTGAMEPVGYGIKKLAQGAGSRIGDVVAGKAAKDAADVADEIATMRGQLGGESQKMSRLFENTQRAAGGGVLPIGQSPVNPTLQRDAILALTEPGTARLQEKVLKRGIDEMGGQASKVAGLEHDLAEKVALAGDEASKRTSSHFKPSAFETEIAPRIGRQVQNAAIGAAAGAPVGAGMMMFGGGPSALTGSMGAGATLGLSKGAITSTKNALASPRVQVGALNQFLEAAEASRSGLQSSARAASPVAQSESEREAIAAFLDGTF